MGRVRSHHNPLTSMAFDMLTGTIEAAVAEPPRQISATIMALRKAWHRTVHRLTLCLCVATLLGAAGAAMADRPGTPMGERAWECYFNAVPRKFAGAPTVCVSFYNTAREEVTFDIEATINGNKLWEWAFLRNKAHCGPAHPLTLDKCVALRNILGIPFTAKGKGEQLFYFTDLAFDTEYCFRFKARRASDQMVSALWSNWACARTYARPPAPATPFTRVHVLPEQWASDLRTKLPPRVQVSWEWHKGRPHYAAFVKIEVEATNRHFDPAIKSVVKPSKEYAQEPHVSYGHPQIFDIPAGMRTDGSLPELKFTVCAYNVSGRTCSRPVSTVAGTMHEQVVSRLNRSVPQVLNPGNPDGIVQDRPGMSPSVVAPPSVPSASAEALRDRRGAASVRAIPGLIQQSPPSSSGDTATCTSGYVWREARPGDLVCVTPQSRVRVAEENRTAASRLQPGGGAYGPNTCLSGFVWREAFAGDVVCVTPQSRALVREENRLGPSLRAQGQPAAAPASGPLRSLGKKTLQTPGIIR